MRATCEVDRFQDVPLWVCFCALLCFLSFLLCPSSPSNLPIGFARGNLVPVLALRWHFLHLHWPRVASSCPPFAPFMFARPSSWNHLCPFPDGRPEGTQLFCKFLYFNICLRCVPSSSICFASCRRSPTSVSHALRVLFSFGSVILCLFCFLLLLPVSPYPNK